MISKALTRSAAFALAASAGMIIRSSFAAAAVALALQCLDAAAAVPAVSSTDAAAQVEANYQGLWWNTSEPGWGINLEHQGSTVVATWFTYDTQGKAVWLTMAAQKIGTSTFVGTLYTTRGPAFNAEPFDAKAVVATEAGTGTLSFTDADNGTFRYVIGAVDQTKQITRYLWGTPPTCIFGTTRALTGMWWNNPPGSESGWGVSFTHQAGPVGPFGGGGGPMVAVWYTYDLDGSPMWLSGTDYFFDGWIDNVLYRTSGARFDAFNAGDVVYTRVGEFSFDVGLGGSAFSYSVTMPGMTESVDGTKSITPFVFAAPVSDCEYF